MRTFFSYGPLDPEEHYYAPRKGLLDNVYSHLMGKNTQEGIILPYGVPDKPVKAGV